MKVCIVCGGSISSQRVDKCLECSKKAMRELFKENPDLKQAFKETIDEMKKPENIQKMVDDIVPVVEKLKSMRGVEK